jgi:hypothetical protein
VPNHVRPKLALAATVRITLVSGKAGNSYRPADLTTWPQNLTGRLNG